MYNLGFGNSVCVREAFLDNYLQNPVYFSKDELLKMDYPNHFGDPELVEITKKVIKRQTGNDFFYVFLTNGATGAIKVALDAYRKIGFKDCVTRPAPYYLRYPDIIKSSGLGHFTTRNNNHNVYLLDVPSNPLSLTDYGPTNGFGDEVIVDGVYMNNVYAPFVKPYLDTGYCLVGSYSKLLGINGVRVGWLATNHMIMAEHFKTSVIANYCGISVPSTELLKNIMVGLNWEKFERSARMKLDYNREEFSKLERFFDGTPVSDIGMFYYTGMDEKAQQLFEKAKINWTKGSLLGTNDSYARFNLGQSNKVVEDAVEAVFKADRRRK